MERFAEIPAGATPLRHKQRHKTPRAVSEAGRDACGQPAPIELGFTAFMAILLIVTAKDGRHYGFFIVLRLAADVGAATGLSANTLQCETCNCEERCDLRCTGSLAPIRVSRSKNRQYGLPMSLARIMEMGID